MPSYLTPGVYIEEVPSGSASLSAGATAIAAFVGFTEKGPNDDPSDPEGMKPRLVTSWSQYESLYGGFTPGAMLPHSVYGWFLNGGSVCYIVRIPHNKASEEPGQLALPAADRAIGNVLEFTSVGPADGISIAVEPAEAPDTEDGSDPDPIFDLSVLQDGVVVESYAGLSLKDGPTNVVSTLAESSERVKVDLKVEITDDLDLTLAMPKAGIYALEPAPREPVEVKAPAFAGSETKRQGINGLVIADDVTMVMVPDLITAATKEDGAVDLGMWKSVQTALINHCEAQANRMAVLDAPPGMSVQQIKEWRSDVAMYDSAFAALYFPWIKVANPAPTNGDDEIFVPPSGHMAGLWARVDESRGVWKAPANEIIRGVLDVELPITKAEQGLLNPIGINCIRPFGTRGIRVWGARTLSSDSDWRYINVRRLFNMVEQAIMDGTQWVVFEPNDQKLWEGVKRTVSGFLRGLWRDGALFGATADQAYFVKCDAENNPPESIDEGKLVVEVGIAPVKPAEFVIFRISQLKDSSS
ncbi:MAG TPA: phage tail sheath subtilisin-like domain-containing protein [Egicoccus sp.]|nr:phage tail sheath subtilisin-like domain-containing protein [Egicoccus sp.]HSK24912.1 phage tail sheath subtilisin-like domain-containing protein [Egicoccus sp.]